MLYVKVRPVLSDPGLLVEESDAASLVGMPGYVPPERFTDAASDIYSLGVYLRVIRQFRLREPGQVCGRGFSRDLRL